MNFVLDTSLTLAWVLLDEASPETDAVLSFLVGSRDPSIRPASLAMGGW